MYQICFNSDLLKKITKEKEEFDTEVKESNRLIKLLKLSLDNRGFD